MKGRIVNGQRMRYWMALMLMDAKQQLQEFEAMNRKFAWQTWLNIG